MRINDAGHKNDQRGGLIYLNPSQISRVKLYKATVENKASISALVVLPP